MSADVSLAIGDRGLRWFAIAFVITQLVEVPLHTRALRSSASRGAPRGGDGTPHRSRPVRMALAFGASALTHPLVWFVFPPLTASLLSSLARTGVSFGLPVRTLLYGILAEGFAVLAEAAYLRAFGVRRALVWSLAANTASVIVGTAIVLVLG